MPNINIDRIGTAAAYVTLCCVVVLLSGCGGSSGSGPQMVQGTGQFGNLKFTTTTESSEPPGVPFTITYSFVNTGATPLVVAVPGPLFDAIANSGSTLVWQLSATQGGIAPGWRIQTIQPGQVTSGTATWSQIDNNFHQVARGQYSLTAWSYLTNIGPQSFTAAEAQASFSTSPIMVTIR